jgi:hypothetical protein
MCRNLYLLFFFIVFCQSFFSAHFTFFLHVLLSFLHLSNLFFLSSFIFLLLFRYCFIPVSLAHVILSLAYPNLLVTKMLGYCCPDEHHTIYAPHCCSMIDPWPPTSYCWDVSARTGRHRRADQRRACLMLLREEDTRFLCCSLFRPGHQTRIIYILPDWADTHQAHWAEAVAHSAVNTDGCYTLRSLFASSPVAAPRCAAASPSRPAGSLLLLSLGAVAGRACPHCSVPFLGSAPPPVRCNIAVSFHDYWLLWSGGLSFQSGGIRDAAQIFLLA